MPYLNHAGTSWPKPPEVVAAAGVVYQSSPQQWPELFAEASAAVARFFHVDASRLLITPSCTAALQLAMLDHPWQAGDRLITSHFEHHALQRCAVKLKERGVEVSTLRYNGHSLIQLEDLEQQLKKGGVRLVALTAACNVTGQMIPLTEAIELAHRFDALILIDGAQIAGWWDLSLPELGADLFTFAGHKAPQAPWGAGGLYVRPNVAMQCPAAVCSLTELTQKPQAPMPGYCDAGSVNLAALLGLAAGCDWLAQPDQQQRLETARGLVAAFTQAAKELPQVTVYHDTATENKMPAVALSIDGLTAWEAGEQLRSHAVVVSAGFQCAPQAHQALGTAEDGVIRFSFGVSNTQDDLNKAVAALTATAAGN